MRRFLCLWCGLLSFSFLFFTSCEQKDEATLAQLSRAAKTKPSVAIAPIIDSTNFDSTWSLSEELTSLLYSQILASNKFSLPPQDNVEKASSFSKNPFGKDLSWVKHSFNGQDFVVFLELVQHEQKEIKKSTDMEPQNLDMGLRIRILDLRGKKPALVLQELLQDSYFISAAQSNIDYEKKTWGTQEYSATPLYRAHLQLMQEACLRINDYILAATRR
jgi:hypothetical protein